MTAIKEYTGHLRNWRDLCPELGIGTGLASVALVKYNGEPLTDADASEAASVGLDQNGEFVLYIRTEEVVDTPKVITLKADGYAEVVITIRVVAPDDPEQT